MHNEPSPVADGRQIFERLLEAYGVSTMQELALSMLENLSTVKGWKQRGSVPIEYCARAALHTKCSLDWLVLGLGPMRYQSMEFTRGGVLAAREQEPVYGQVLHYRARSRQLSFVLVPRYVPPRLEGGRNEEGDIGEIAFEASWMSERFGRAGAGFALLDVSGNSMEPTLWDGETVLVDLQSRDVVSGGIYVLRDGQDLLVKRLQRLFGGGVELVSDNANFRSQAVPDPEQLTVIGRVVWPKVR